MELKISQVLFKGDIITRRQNFDEGTEKFSQG
jgi:hypothetical protein